VKKRRKWLKILIIVTAVVLVIFAGMMVYLTNGLDEVKKMAIDDVDVSRIADGTYEGSFSAYRWSNTVQVTVKSGKITAIETVGDPSFRDTATADELIARVKGRQTPQVDTVSGATVSSKAFLKAVENALKGA